MKTDTINVSDLYQLVQIAYENKLLRRILEETTNQSYDYQDLSIINFTEKQLHWIKKQDNVATINSDKLPEILSFRQILHTNITYSSIAKSFIPQRRTMIFQ